MQPLAGVRVLAVEQYGAGPFGTMYLANQGAEVIKIENRAAGGDPAVKAPISVSTVAVKNWCPGSSWDLLHCHQIASWQTLRHRAPVSSDARRPRAG